MADNNNPIKYSDLVSPDNSITDLIKQLDDLSDTYTNALKNIRAEAIQLSAVLKTVSGATEEGRRTTKNASEDADRLAKAQRELAFAESENAKKLAELKHAQQEANTINKLLVKINNSAEGSYNRLSAQYSLNKIYLNNMSTAEREGTEAGRKLEEETKALYEEMKRLQEATGKHQLNVGNYAGAMIDAAAAAEQMASKIEKNTKQLAMMKMEGKETTEEYQKLLQETATLKDAMADASAEVANMASDTSKLDAVLAGASAASGGFAAYAGAMELFGEESEDVEKAQRKLQAAIALATGVQQIQNAVQKQSALMLGISRIQLYAKAKAEALATATTKKGTIATAAATVAQKAFNAVAYANPYIILAMALIAVVGALVAFTNDTEDATDAQKAANEVEAEYLKYKEESLKSLNAETIAKRKEKERELELAKLDKKDLQERNALEAEILSLRREEIIKSRIRFKEEINNLKANQKELLRLHGLIIFAKDAAAENKELSYTIDGEEIEKSGQDAVDHIQGLIDNLSFKVNIAEDLEEDFAEINHAWKVAQKQYFEAHRKMKERELQYTRQAEDAETKLITDEYSRRRKELKTAYDREVADVQKALGDEADVTDETWNQANRRLKALREQLNRDLQDLTWQRMKAERDAERETEDVRYELMEEGFEKRRALTVLEYEREIEDLKWRLTTERNLTTKEREEINAQILLLQQKHVRDMEVLAEEEEIQQASLNAERIELRLAAVKAGSEDELRLRKELLQEQRKVEIATNKALAEDMQQSEEDINAKYNAELLRLEDDFNKERALNMLEKRQAFEQSEFDLLRNSEERKTQFQLRAEKERLQELLRINEAANIKMSDMEVETIKNTIARIDNEIKQSKKAERADIYGLFGLNLDDEQKEAIDTATNYAMDALQQYMDAYTAAADAKVQKADAEIESAKSLLDAEIEARNNGYAHNVQMAQKELDIAKKNQEKALKEQQKAQKAQAAIQTVQQIGNLVTSTSMIWAQLGFPWAIPAIALMWGSFAAAKIKAVQMTSQEYGEGTVELLDGGSHQSGNDVDLGVKPDGTRRRAEGGEFFAVINKRNSRRFRRHIPSVINSLNDGTFERKYLNAYNGEGLTLNVAGSSPDLRNLSEDVREIKEQNRRRIYTAADGAIYESYKNLTRKIKRI